MKRAAAMTLLALMGLGLAAGARAQFMSSEPLTFTITPSYPRPYQSVTVVPESTVIDLSASTVTVSVNGSVVSRGTGAEAAYITVGGPGTVTTVSVTATNGGQTYTKSITIRPAEVSLIVESGATSHPFYEGGALIASEGNVRIVALADLKNSAGASIPPANLVYTWRNGNQILQGSSGIGKSVLSAVAPVKWRDAPITVTVTSQDQSVVAEAVVTIAPSDPFLRVYRNDPLLGPLFGTALSGTIALNGDEETYRAVPYFFSQKPAFSWRVNDVMSDSDQDVTVRASGSGGGTARLDVSGMIAGTGETAATGLAVSFGGRRFLDIFGL